MLDRFGGQAGEELEPWAVWLALANRRWRNKGQLSHMILEGYPNVFWRCLHNRSGGRSTLHLLSITWRKLLHDLGLKNRTCSTTKDVVVVDNKLLTRLEGLNGHYDKMHTPLSIQNHTAIALSEAEDTIS